MNLSKLLLIAAGLGAICCARPLCAQDPEQSRLDEINVQVESQKARLAETKEKYLTLETELKGLRALIEKLRQQQKGLEEELVRNQTSRSTVSQELQDAERRMERTQRLSQERLKAFYVYRATRGVQGVLMLIVQDSPHLMRNVVYLDHLQRYDKELLQSLAALQLERQKRQAELARLIEEQNTLQKKLKTQAQTVQSKISRQEAVLKELKTEQAQIQAVINELRAQALRLETVVASLTGADVEKERAVEHPATPRAGTSREPYPGSGLKAQRGALAVPALGRVLRPYGKQKLSEFDEIVLSKGLEFQLAAGAEIRAVADGRVIFLGRMPGYGTVLILDHGERCYSLYGRLGEVAVEAGEDVEKAKVIAQAGTLDEKGRNFYFEIRENGSPVDPHGYFSKRQTLG